MKKIINLLPEERKLLLTVDKLNRFIFKIGLVLILAIFVFVSFLGSLFFILNFNQNANIIEHNQNKIGKIENLSQEMKALAEEQDSKTRDFIKKIESRILYWDYLNDINEILPKEVYYFNLEIEKNNIKIKGLALNRESLMEFKSLLEGNKNFKKIEMPISNLTSPKNINFEIDIEVNKQ